MRYNARSGQHFILKGGNILICLHIQCVPVPKEIVKTPGSNVLWSYLYDKVAALKAPSPHSSCYTGDGKTFSLYDAEAIQYDLSWCQK